MAKISILIALLPHLFCVLVQGQPSSCSEYFTYMTKPGITDVIGQIEISPPSVNEEFHLKVALNTATELTSQVVRLELAQSIQESVLAASFGRSLLYHVHYPTHEPLPSLSAIWFNNQQYCPDPQVSDNITATIELGHILYPPNIETLVINSGPWQQISQPWDRNSSLYRIDNPNYDRLNKESEFDTECGIPSNYTDDTNRLIHNGEKTLPNQWPWLVAIYLERPDLGGSYYRFECSGFLLTTRHVITEMYCVLQWKQHYNSRKLVVRDKVHVFFGQFNSRVWHRDRTGIVNRQIMELKIFHFVLSKGLAILILRTAVEYNAFIRPICLWSGSTNLQDIVNMTGYIVGWGYDISGSNGSYYDYVIERRMVKVPLTELSERVPKLDFRELVITEPRWNNTSSDRGNGLVIFNIQTGRYELRGVGYSSTSQSCNLEFADLTNQMFWIRQQIILSHNAGSSL